MTTRPKCETVAFGSEDGASDFVSGAESLDRFFSTQAGQAQRRNSSRTWVLRRPAERLDLPAVLGFYTLALGTVERESLPDKMVKGLSPYYPVPVIIIARLARHVRVKGQGYGERLLLDAQERCIHVSEQAGGVAVVVDAIDKAAMSFYAQFGYQGMALAQTDQDLTWPLRMIQALSTIRKAHLELC